MEKLRIEATVLREYSQEQQMQASLDIDIPEPKNHKILVKLDSDASTFFTVGDKKEDKLFLFYPILDKMIESLNDRFSHETKEVICNVGKAMYLGVGYNKMEASDFEYLFKTVWHKPSWARDRH